MIPRCSAIRRKIFPKIDRDRPDIDKILWKISDPDKKPMSASSIWTNTALNPIRYGMGYLRAFPVPPPLDNFQFQVSSFQYCAVSGYDIDLGRQFYELT